MFDDFWTWKKKMFFMNFAFDMKDNKNKTQVWWENESISIANWNKVQKKKQKKKLTDVLAIQRQFLSCLQCPTQ